MDRGIEVVGCLSATTIDTLYELDPADQQQARRLWLDGWLVFMDRLGQPVTRAPIMAKRVLDLYKLYRAVVQHGGILEVINRRLWHEVVGEMGLPRTITSAAFTLRSQYKRYLYDYECHEHHFSTPAEYEAAVEANKRDGRRHTPEQYAAAAVESAIPDGRNLATAAERMAATVEAEGLDRQTKSGGAASEEADGGGGEAEKESATVVAATVVADEEEKKRVVAADGGEEVEGEVAGWKAGDVAESDEDGELLGSEWDEVEAEPSLEEDEGEEEEDDEGKEATKTAVTEESGDEDGKLGSEWGLVEDEGEEEASTVIASLRQIIATKDEIIKLKDGVIGAKLDALKDQLDQLRAELRTAGGEESSASAAEAFESWLGALLQRELAGIKEQIGAELQEAVRQGLREQAKEAQKLKEAEKANKAKQQQLLETTSAPASAGAVVGSFDGTAHKVEGILRLMNQTEDYYLRISERSTNPSAQLLRAKETLSKALNAELQKLALLD